MLATELDEDLQSQNCHSNLTNSVVSGNLHDISESCILMSEVGIITSLLLCCCKD